MKRKNTIYNCDLCEKQHTGGDVTPLGWVELNCPRPGNVDEFQDRCVHVCAECVGKIAEQTKEGQV